MNDHLSTEEVGWVLGRSAGAIREAVKSGDIAGSRTTAGFRIPREEVLRLAREKVEGETGTKISDKAWRSSSTTSSRRTRQRRTARNEARDTRHALADDCDAAGSR